MDFLAILRLCEKLILTQRRKVAKERQTVDYRNRPPPLANPKSKIQNLK
jgi:hypothetical protein